MIGYVANMLAWNLIGVHAVHVWPQAKRDELTAWLWSRAETQLRILASVIERPEPPAKAWPAAEHWQ